jgi:hypothetical protein
LPEPWPPAAGSGAPLDPTILAVICPTIPSTAICGSADLTCRVIGQNFTASCVAYLDNVAQTTTFVNTGELTFPIRPSTVPTAKASTITVRDGAATAAGNCRFTFTAAPLLAINSLVPNTAQCASPDVLVTVNGTVFTATCVLMVDGANVATTYVSPTQLRYMADSSAELTPRAAIVTVKDGATAGLGAPTFTFTAIPPLMITSINPDTAQCLSPDVLVTATGLQFTPTCVLQWDGANVTTTYVSPTTLRFTADTSAEALPRQAQVTVRDGATVGQGAPLFTLTAIPLPVILCPLVPASAEILSADVVVTVNGSNFQPTSVVLVDGAAVATIYVSTTQLRFTARPSAEATPRRAIVGVRNGTATSVSTCPFDFTQVVLTPALSAIFPDIVGFSDAPKTITYTGSNFTPTSVVMRGALALTTTYVNATTLTTTTSAANATTGTFDMRVRSGTALSNSMQAQCVLNPVLNSLVPNTAPRGSAQLEVQLLGANFGNTATVIVNGAAVPTRWVNGSDVRFDLTPPATAGSVPVTIRIGHQHGGSHDNVVPVAPPLSLQFTFT